MKYYPQSNLAIGDRVRVTSADLIGYVKGIRLDEFGDELIDLTIPNIPNDTYWVARSTEVKPQPVNVYSRHEHRSA